MFFHHPFEIKMKSAIWLIKGITFLKNKFHHELFL